ncbi:MAG: MMPL family transporter [Myxococcota bacterium]
MSDARDPSASDHPIVRARWAVVVLVVALCAWLVPGVSLLQHDDDVLAFLPPEDPDVVAFREVADRFGMLEVVLVGLSHDEPLLTPERTEKVRTLHTRLTEVPGVRLVLSYPEFPEAKVVEQTLVVQALVPPGTTDAEQIRRRVLGNRDAVGNFISIDGSAAAILAYLEPATGDDRVRVRNELLGTIRGVVDEHWDGDAYYGGAPFMERAASTASREDIERLSPIVIGVLVIASALLLGSVTAAGLNLVITGLGVALIVGAHGRFDEPFTIVSSTTPVMMVALGGAFGMHMLAGFQRHAGTSRQRASATLRELWKPVLLSGLTTATAFFALQAMPQVPMQRFGIVAGIGMFVLLLLALVALTALLAVLPAGLLPTRENPHLPLRVMPPLWLVAALGVGGAALGSQLQSDPDTTELFDPDSEPRQADAFFNEHFGGSQFLQIAVQADLKQPAVLREIRQIADEIRQIEGVADVRSLVEPVGLVSEGFGGRRGIPSTQPRTRRVIVSLGDHPAMTQLMVPEADAAIVHIKLTPGDGEHQQRVTREVRAVVLAHAREALPVGDAQSDALRPVVREAVRTRLSRFTGQAIDDARLEEILQTKATAASMQDELVRLRDRALGTDELMQGPAPDAERESVDPAKLFELRGPALASYLTQQLPTAVERDPEDVSFVAELLPEWIDEAAERSRVLAACGPLGLPPPSEGSGADPSADPSADPGEQGALPSGERGPRPPAERPRESSASSGPVDDRCQRLPALLSELTDAEWTIPAGIEAEELGRHPWSVQLTGQPVIGQAFAQSVSTSLRNSTLVSLGALAVVLLVFGQLRALVPAVWTVMLTVGVIYALGHPISIGTSMVTCIALGAGVDFAIHLGIRARASTGAQPGREATEALGGVILVTGVQLALAFLVLLASEMPPLQQFGAGLAVGLLGAAAGAVWLTPRLYPPVGPPVGPSVRGRGDVR